MLTNAPILAIVPTTDIARAKAFYGETLGLTNANVSTPGPQVFDRCGGGTLLEVTSVLRRVRRNTPLPHGL